jgi:hypothetical protein
MDWAVLIGLVALAFAIVSFSLYVIDAMRTPPPPEEVVLRAQAHIAGVDLGKLAEFAKALADAFHKVGPGLVALIGAILFLLLSGEALGVYQLTGPSAPTEEDGAGDTGEGSGDDAGGNDADANVTANIG